MRLGALNFLNKRKKPRNPSAMWKAKDFFYAAQKLPRPFVEQHALKSRWILILSFLTFADYASLDFWDTRPRHPKSRAGKGSCPQSKETSVVGLGFRV